MKKAFIILIFLLLITGASIFGVLFTKTGNSYIASYIQNKVNDGQEKVKLKVESLNITFDRFDFKATIDDNSMIDISGDLKLFEKIVDLKYDIKVKELAHFEKLINKRLNGPFFTSGIFKGNDKSALIKGISDVASSQTEYKIDLIDFEPLNIDFLVKDARIEKFLHLINEPMYATGKLNIKGDIKNSRIGQLDGIINAKVTRGKLVNEVVNKSFKQNISSRIGFTSDIKAKLIGNTIEAKSDLITSLADIFANKTIIDLKYNKIISDYKINMKNISKLKGVIGKKLNGKFMAQGDVVVDNGDMKINGNSDIFNSNTKFDIKMQNSELKNINFEVKNAKIDEFLHMLNEPVYAVGNFTINGDVLNSENNGLGGKIFTKISNGKLINEVVNTVFKQNIKQKVSFNGDINTILKPTIASSKIILNSSLAKFSTQNTDFTYKNGLIQSDYDFQIPSLEKMKGLTGKKIRGKLNINGNLRSKSSSIYVDGKSDLIGGNLNFELRNDNLVANLKNGQIRQLSYMFYYPEVFDSKTDIDLKYNLLLKKGKITSTLLNGHFLPNDFSSLINQFANFDLTREVYDTTKIDSKIDNMILNSIVKMSSKNTKIEVPSSVINLEKNITNTKIKVDIKKVSFGANIKGNMSNPKIKLDTKELFKSQLNKQFKKNEDKIKKKLNKVLGDKLGKDGAENLINNIKSLF